MFNPRDKPGSRIWPIVITAVVVVAMILVGVFLPLRRVHLWIWAWIINLVGMFVLMGTFSLSVGTKFWGIFVDSRNMVSLSRFQIVLWTLVVLSAFWTIGLSRVGDAVLPEHKELYVCESPPLEEEEEGQEPQEGEPCAAPLDLQLPGVLWALMGISVTSAVASPLIKQNKMQTTKPKEDEYTHTLDTTLEYVLSQTEREEFKKLTPKDPKKEFWNIGAVIVRNPAFPARFSDMFKGEGVGDIIYVDMAKVQNFFFTVVSVVTYAVALGAAITGAESISALFQFPDVSEGLLAVLSISHAAYLVDKQVTTSMPTP